VRLKDTNKSDIVADTVGFLRRLLHLIIKVAVF